MDTDEHVAVKCGNMEHSSSLTSSQDDKSNEAKKDAEYEHTHDYDGVMDTHEHDGVKCGNMEHSSSLTSSQDDKSNEAKKDAEYEHTHDYDGVKYGNIDRLHEIKKDVENGHTLDYFGVKYGKIGHSSSLTSSHDDKSDETKKDVGYGRAHESIGVKLENTEHSSSQTSCQDVTEKNVCIQNDIGAAAFDLIEEIVNGEPISNLLSSDAPKQTTTLKSSNVRATEQPDGNLMKEIDHEVIELSLENFLEDPEAYEAFCPNCNCCIERVILRKKKQESRPPQHQVPADIFRCMSCFSFLILAGRQFVSLFVPDKKEVSIGNELFMDLHEIDSTLPTGTERLPTQNVYLSPRDKASSSIESVLVRNVATEFLVSKKDFITSVTVPEIPNQEMVNDLVNQNGTENMNDIDANHTQGDLIYTSPVNEIEEKYNPSIKQAVVALSDHIGQISSTQNDGLTVDSFDDRLVVDVPIGSLKSGKEILDSTIQVAGKVNDVIINLKGNLDDDVKMTEAGPVEPLVEHSAISQEDAILETRGPKQWDILKSMVYGGLIESITSLSIVTSAVGVSASTVNILALGLANLISGLFILGHNLRELKQDGFRVSHQTNEHVDQYQELLGQRENFIRHAIVAVLSYLIFGTVPVVTYVFSFGESNEREARLAVAMAASLFCIIMLANGKAHIQREPKLSTYIKTVFYYGCSGVVTSIISYIAGSLILKLVEKLGWFKESETVTLFVPETTLLKSA